MFTLRDFQEKAIDEVRQAIRDGNKRIVLVSPTGSGKTVMASAIAKSSRDKGRKVVFLAPRRELVYQASEKLAKHEVNNGMIMAGEHKSIMSMTQVACIPTLHARCIRKTKEPLPPADLILVDEAHLSITDMTLSVLSKYPNAVVIGLTATPARSDGKGLGEYYSAMVEAPTVAELTRLGHLVPARYFAPTTFDVSGVKTAKGDYVEKQLAQAVDKPVLWGDVVTNWLRIARGRPTVVYGVNVAHSMHLRDSFLEAGIRAEHIDADTPTKERREILNRFEVGQTEVICNCEVLSYGWDCPSASAVVLARPTKSIVAYFQMVGRVLRPHFSKTDALVLDHGGIVDKLGFVDEPVAWSLDSDSTVQERTEAKRKEKKEGKKMTCPNCHALFVGTLTCPNCGTSMPSHYAKYLNTAEDDLAEIDRNKRRQNREWTTEQKAHFMGELLGYAKEKGRNEGWAAHKYKEKFGVWPNHVRDKGLVAPITPSAETRSWIKSRAIAWSHSNKNPKNQKKAAA